jgi:alanine racemase
MFRWVIGLIRGHEGPPGATPVDDGCRDRPTRAIIHLGAVRANYAEAERRAGGRAVIAVIKADAYGHGAIPVAQSLVRAGCPHLAVLGVREAAELRDAQVGVPILVLGGVHTPAGARAAAELGVTPVVHHRGHVSLLTEAARAAGGARTLGVQVEVDTGMRRMGVPPDDAVALLEEVRAERALRLEGVFTHLAQGDDPDLGPSIDQFAAFRRVLAAARERGIEPGMVHGVNSAGLLAGEVLADALPEATAVRPGIMLYGVAPAPHLEAGLQPAMTLTTRVVHVRRVAAGETVGYGARFRASRNTRVATLPAGYADGVPVSASNRGCVRIRGRELPLVGRVSMDFVGVDVGDTPVEIGDEALIFGALGSERLPVEQAAVAADTLAYELLVRVGARARRDFED